MAGATTDAVEVHDGWLDLTLAAAVLYGRCPLQPCLLGPQALPRNGLCVRSSSARWTEGLSER